MPNLIKIVFSLLVLVVTVPVAAVESFDGSHSELYQPESLKVKRLYNHGGGEVVEEKAVASLPKELMNSHETRINLLPVVSSLIGMVSMQFLILRMWRRKRSDFPREYVKTGPIYHSEEIQGTIWFFPGLYTVCNLLASLVQRQSGVSSTLVYLLAIYSLVCAYKYSAAEHIRDTGFSEFYWSAVFYEMLMVLGLFLI